MSDTIGITAPDVDTAVFYFSASGVTARVGVLLAGLLGADAFEIVPAGKYSKEDLDWTDPASRSTIEMKDPASRPDFTCRVENMAKYKTILLGFPIWWYEAPRVIQSFLERYRFDGITIIPFATSGGSGMGDTVSILQRSAPKAVWREGKRLDPNISVHDLNEWIQECGL